MRHNRSSRGHTCIPREKLLKPCADLLSTNEDTIDITIDSLVSTAQLNAYIIEDTEFIFLPSSFRDEKRIAERMGIVAKFPPPRMSTLAETIDNIEYENNIKYNKKRQQNQFIFIRILLEKSEIMWYTYSVKYD